MSARDKNPGQVWDVFDWLDRGLSGYLVTAEGGLDFPLAYVSAEEQSSAAAMGLAERIAADVTTLDRPRTWGLDDAELCHDLRWRGTRGMPMPRWVYGLRCRPHGDDDAVSMTPAPFCPWLLAEMAEAQVSAELLAARRALKAVAVKRAAVATITDGQEAKDRRGRGVAPTPRRQTSRPSETLRIPTPAKHRDAEAAERTGELVA